MPDLRCSVCGVLTLETDLGAHASTPEPECALASGVTRHVICGSCTTKLSQDIAEGRTSILRPHESGKEALSEAAEESKSAMKAASRFIKSSKITTHSPGQNPGSSGLSRDPDKIEFDFAKKRHFAGYELLGEISRGSFGVVYKARQAGLDRVVALKVLLDGVHASSEAVERFNREAKSVARLKHPNVVPIYDIGACDGHHYFAMEFIEGYPLSTHILARTLTISDSLAIAECIADAIECAHRAGVIHRDIKPSNILVDKHGVPHITDFGLAKQVDLENKYTMSGTTLGTPAYMPPEQARGQINKIDARSDVYALGTVLYEMLTGVTPFSGRSLLEVVVAVINEPVAPPRQLNPKIHRDVQTIVLKCLEKEREQRYSSAADLRDDLKRFRSGEAILARPAGVISRMRRVLKRQKWYIASSVAGAAVVLSTAALVADNRHKDENIRKERESILKKVEELKDKEQIKWKKVWEFTGSSGLEPGRTQVYSSEGKLAPAETLVSPDGEILFGDWRATIEFALTADAASHGVTAGIQSVTDISGVPYVVSLKGNTVRLFGPNDLYSFWNAFKQNKDIALPLEVKIEKEIPTLVAGLYKLNIERNGIRLKFTISGDPSRPDISQIPLNAPFNAMLPPQPTQPPPPWGPVNVEIQDYNLSNWIMKQTQLVLRRPPGGLLVQGGDAHYKLGGPGGLEVNALNYFYSGEYKFAAIDFGVVAQSGDELNQARAKYYLGLIGEISGGGPINDVIASYLDAKQTLYHLRPAKNSTMYQEQNDLLKEIRIRLAVCYAKKNDWVHPADRWQAVDEELAQGWMDNAKVGETLGWELQGVMDMAQREPNKDAIMGPALNVFKRCGLDPASTRVAENARQMGMLLSSKSRYIELRELFNAIPTPALNDVFADAASHALPALPDEAFKLLTYIPPESKSVVKGQPPKPPSKLALKAVDVIAALMKEKHWQQGQTLLLRYPTQQGYIRFFDELPLDSVFAETAAAFYADGLPKVLAAAPRDDAVRVSIDRSLERMGRYLDDNARFGELIPLHVAIRQNGAKQDPRLAAFFAEAVENLSATGDPDSDDLSLNLLRYASEHVARSQAGLRQAAIEMAKRKASNGDDASFKMIIRIKDAYPAARLAPFARQALHEYCQARRYDDAITYFMQARGKFVSEGAALLPDLITALEHTEVGLRERLLDSVWLAVRDDLKRYSDDIAVRQWQLEFGDLDLALGNWPAARKNYQNLLAFQTIDPSVAARAALRLAALNQARPDTTGPIGPLRPTGDEIFTPIMTAKGAPADITLAAQALAPVAAFHAKDMPDKVKAIQPPALSHEEWMLLYGLRARMDSDDAAAQQFFKQALERAQPDRLWTAAVASDLLRPKKLADKEPSTIRPEADEPP